MWRFVKLVALLFVVGFCAYLLGVMGYNAWQEGAHGFGLFCAGIAIAEMVWRHVRPD